MYQNNYRLVKIRPHPEGGQVRIRSVYKWVARLYVLAVIEFRVFVEWDNLANWENPFERAMDFVQVADYCW